MISHNLAVSGNLRQSMFSLAHKTAFDANYVANQYHPKGLCRLCMSMYSNIRMLLTKLQVLQKFCYRMKMNTFHLVP